MPDWLKEVEASVSPEDVPDWLVETIDGAGRSRSAVVPKPVQPEVIAEAPQPRDLSRRVRPEAHRCVCSLRPLPPRARARPDGEALP